MNTIDCIAFIDFETANSARDSICAVGVSVQKNGVEIQHFYSLVRPEPLKIDRLNQSVHNIEYCDLINAPTFDSIFTNTVKPLLTDIVASHNADFDMDCLSTYLFRHNIDFPDFRFLCTKKLSEKLSKDSSLEAMTALFGLPSFESHNALADARACGQLFWKLREKLGDDVLNDNLEFFIDRIEIEKDQARFYKPAEEVNTTAATLPFKCIDRLTFSDKKFIVTGNFAEIKRADVESIIAERGGKIQTSPSSKTDYIVVGSIASDGWASGNYGRKIEKALTLPNIVFISESEFIKHI